MTHPSIPLEKTPTFASMLTDPRFAEIARELLDNPRPPAGDPYNGSSHSVYLRRHTGLDNCPICQPISLSFELTNPRPPRDDRHLAICAVPATDPSRLEPVKTHNKKPGTPRRRSTKVSR